MKIRYALICISMLLVGISNYTAPISLAYEVGHITQTFEDESRIREIQSEIYYPSPSGGDNAPISDGVFPVIAFGHGFTIIWSDYEYLWTGVVTQGYIMVFPRTEEGFIPSHLNLGKDLAFLVEKFQELGASSTSMFYQHIHSESAIMGHSMGGGASFLGIEYSPSTTTFITFAAAETSPSAIDAAESIIIPALVFSGSEDCVTPPANHQIPMYEALASDCKAHITITGASHCQFAQNNFLCRTAEILSGCSASISMDSQESITLQYILPWLNYMLKDNSAAWQTFQNLLSSGAMNGTITFVQDCVLPIPTPTSAPSVTATPRPTATSLPTATPNPSQTPVVTNTPQLTPTPFESPTPYTSPTVIPPCTTPRVLMIMPSHFFAPDDLCYLNAELCNPDSMTYMNVPLVVVLDVYGSYFFYPEWKNELTSAPIDVVQGNTVLHIIEPFTWPQSAGSAENLWFYGAMLNEGLTELWGEFGSWMFSYGL